MLLGQVERIAVGADETDLTKKRSGSGLPGEWISQFHLPSHPPPLLLPLLIQWLFDKTLRQY